MHNASKISNSLIDEKSPYLLQHAYNPAWVIGSTALFALSRMWFLVKCSRG